VAVKLRVLCPQANAVSGPALTKQEFLKGLGWKVRIQVSLQEQPFETINVMLIVPDAPSQSPDLKVIALVP